MKKKDKKPFDVDWFMEDWVIPLSVLALIIWGIVKIFTMN